MTITREPQEIAKELAAFLDSYPGTQRELAEMAGVSQSTISRALKGKIRSRLSNGLCKLCNYAKIETHKRPPASGCDPRTNPHLINALNTVWDGSDQHARALAKVIRSLKALHFQSE